MVHSKKLKRRRVQTKPPVHSNRSIGSPRRRQTKKYIPPSHFSTVKSIFLIIQLASLSPVLSQHHYLRDNGVAIDESESTLTFDINSQKPQIRHYNNARAGSILARSVPLAASECDNDNTEVKRRLVAFDLDPIFPPYNNVFEELFVMLDDRDIGQESLEEDVLGHSTASDERDESDRDFIRDNGLMEEIEGKGEQAQREGVLDGVNDTQFIEIEKRGELTEVGKENGGEILVETEREDVLEDELSDLNDTEGVSNNANDNQTDQSEIGTNAESESTADRTSRKSQFSAVVSDGNDIDVSHKLSGVEEVEADVSIEEVDVLVSNTSVSPTSLLDVDTVENLPRNEDEIYDIAPDTHGGNHEIASALNSLEGSSSDIIQENSIEADEDLSDQLEGNNIESALSVESEIHFEMQNVSQNPSLAENDTSEDLNEPLSSDGLYFKTDDAIDTIIDVKAKAVIDEDKAAMPSDNESLNISPASIEESPDASTDAGSEIEINHMLVQEDEVDATEELSMDGQVLDDPEYSSTDDAMVQEDDDSDSKQELIMDGKILIDPEYSSTDDTLVQEDDNSDSIQELIMNGQILVDQGDSSIDDTLVQEDDDIDTKQELIADSHILVHTGYSSIDGALVQEKDDTDEKPELFTDEQITGSAEYNVGANGLKEASAHDQILGNIDSTNIDEILTLIDDEADTEDELITHDQITVSMESRIIDEALTKKDDVNAIDGTSSHDQILVNQGDSSNDDTLVQEDDDIDTKQELIADSHILVHTGYLPIDGALVQEKDDTDAKPELSIDEQITGSAEYNVGADGLKEASAHDQILVNINAMNGKSSISTNGVEELVSTSNAVDPEDTINQASKTPGDTFGYDKDDNITEKFDPSSSQSANDKFVRGLDDFHKLMEEVEPPDELDVGAGSSIQEVLVVQGAQIIKMRVQKGMKQVAKSVSQFKRKTIQGWDNLKNEGKKNEENVMKYYEDNNKLQLALVVIEKQKKNVLNANKIIWSACINFITKARVFLKDLDLLGLDGAEDLDKDFLDYRKVTINDEELAEIRRKTMEKQTEQRGGIDSDGSTALDDIASGNRALGRNPISDEMQERARKQYQTKLLKSVQSDSSDASDTKI